MKLTFSRFMKAFNICNIWLLNANWCNKCLASVRCVNKINAGPSLPKAGVAWIDYNTSCAFVILNAKTDMPWLKKSYMNHNYTLESASIVNALFFFLRNVSECDEKWVHLIIFEIRHTLLLVDFPLFSCDIMIMRGTSFHFNHNFRWRPWKIVEYWDEKMSPDLAATTFFLILKKKQLSFSEIL